MTDPREPFETDSAIEGTDLDDTRFDERGTADIETGAGEAGSAEGSSDTADQDTAGGVADVVPRSRAPVATPSSATPWPPRRPTTTRW